MSSIDFILDREKCIRCNACIEDCPRRIIGCIAGYPGIPPEKENGCIRCQHCLAVCPTGAISILGLRPEDSLPVEMPPPDVMSRFVRGRRTTRQYRAENLDRKLIDELLADTAHAPTGGNTCDLTFTVVDDRREICCLLEKLVDGLAKATARGVEVPIFMQTAVKEFHRCGADEIFRGAPHLLLVSGGEGAYCGEADVMIALSYFELLANSRGIGTTWNGFLKFILELDPSLKELFDLPPDRPYYAIAFGRPAIHYARTTQRDTAAKIKTLKF